MVEYNFSFTTLVFLLGDILNNFHNSFLMVLKHREVAVIINSLWRL